MHINVYHSDHIGETINLVNNFKVENVIFNQERHLEAQELTYCSDNRILTREYKLM